MRKSSGGAPWHHHCFQIDTVPCWGVNKLEERLTLFLGMHFFTGFTAQQGGYLELIFDILCFYNSTNQGFPNENKEAQYRGDFNKHGDFLCLFHPLF